MTLSSTYSTPLIVNGNYDSTTTYVISGANVTFKNADGDEVFVDSIYLAVEDSLGDVVTITDSTIPAITTTGYSYRVEEIDVTGYPTGDITLTWTGELDGYEHTRAYTVAYGTTSNIVVIPGLTATTTDTSVRQDTDTKLYIKLQDLNGNAVDGYGVRARFRDRINNSVVVHTEVATLEATGSGLWSISYDFDSAIFSTGTDRYEIYWEYQLEDGDSWREVANSHHLLSVNADGTSLTTAPLAYCSEQDVRTILPSIDKYLIPLDSNKSNRDLLLQNAIHEVSLRIHNNIDRKFDMTSNNRSMVKYWCAYEVAVDIVGLSSDNLAENGVLKRLKYKVREYKLSLFGHNNFTPVGSGYTHRVADKDYIRFRR